MMTLNRDQRQPQTSIQGDESWQELVARAREAIKDDLGDRKLPPPAEIIQQMREERDEQLLALR